MHAVDLVDGGLRLGDGAEGRGADEGRGPAQPAQRVLLVAGVLGHPRHGERVQRLEQQGAHAADQHGGQVGVDPAGHAVGREVRVVGIGGDRRPARPVMPMARRTVRAMSPRAGAARPPTRRRGAAATEPPSAVARSIGFIDATARAWHAAVAECRPCVSSSWEPVPSVARSGGRLFERATTSRWLHGATTAARCGPASSSRRPTGPPRCPVPVVEDPAHVQWDGDADGDPVVLLAVKGQHTDHALAQLDGGGAAGHAGGLHAERRGERAPRAAPLPAHLRDVRHVPRHPAASRRRAGPLGSRLGPARPGRAFRPAWASTARPSPTPSRRRPSSRWPGPTSCAGSTASSS